MIQLMSKLKNYLLCILRWPESRPLRSWVTARLIQSLRLGVAHLWHAQKLATFFSTTHPYHPKKRIIDLLFKNNRIHRNVTNFTNPYPIFVDIINVCSLIQITFSNLLCKRSLLPILPETYCELTWTDKLSKTYLKSVIIQNQICQHLMYMTAQRR